MIREARTGIDERHPALRDGDTPRTASIALDEDLHVYISPAPIVPPQALTRRIVCLGDSITRGYGVPASQAWPARLEAILSRNARPPWQVINAGVPGDTILQGLARLERDVSPHRPDVVFIAFGLNDAHLARRSTDVHREQALWEQSIRHPRWWLRPTASPLHPLQSLLRRLRRRSSSHAHPPPLEDSPRVSPPAFEQALHLIVRRLRQRQPAPCVFLITPTPITARFHAEWPPQRRERQRALYGRYAAIVRAAARALHTGLIDAAAALSQGDPSRWIGEDGIHLTSSGQALLAELAWLALTTTGLLGQRTIRSP